MYWWIGILVVAFGAPFIAVWWNHRLKRQRFIRGRMSELENPHDSLVRFQLGEMYLKHRYPKKALQYLSESLDIQRHKKIIDPRLLDALGKTLSHFGKYEEAIVLFEESLTLDPTGAQGEVFAHLGFCHSTLGHEERAREWLEKACDTNRSMAEPVFRLACLLSDMGEEKEANQLIREFLSDLGSLPVFVRRNNRKWIWMMRLFPISALFV